MQRTLWTVSTTVIALSLGSALGSGCGDDDSNRSNDGDAGDDASAGSSGTAGRGGGGGSGGVVTGGAGSGGGGAGGGAVPEAGALCGDQQVDPGEDCDDGNDSEDDACLNDCTFACGDGVVNAYEECDTAIASGSAGACPTSCSSSDPCVTTLLAGEACQTTCAETTTTTAANDDGCCPIGENAATDNDCTGTCGNAVVEPGEQCDETSATCDGCLFVPTAFRLTSFEFRDPHLYFDCNDITAAVQQLITDMMNQDSQGGGGGDAGADAGDAGTGDGFLDLSFVVIMRPLVQDGPSTLEFIEGLCVAPAPSTSCGQVPNTAVQSAPYTVQSTGNCLDAIGGTTSGYTPPVQPTTAGTPGCFVTDPGTVQVSLAGLFTFTFQQAQIAAQWSGNPADGLVEGLIRGFISEADMGALALPATLPAPLGGAPLTTFFPGTAQSPCTDPALDDRDIGPDGTTQGWWFYFAFTGQKVTWTGG